MSPRNAVTRGGAVGASGAVTRGGAVTTSGAVTRGGAIGASGAGLAGAGAVALGLLTVAWPIPWMPPWADAVAGLGAVAVLAAAVLRWQAPSAAVAAAVTECAVSHAGAAALAAEGLLILGYLLTADAPPGLAGRRAARWLWRQAPLLAAGAVAAAAGLAALAVRPAASGWIALAGLAATVTAYLIALPRRPRPGDRPGLSARPVSRRGRSVGAAGQ